MIYLDHAATTPLPEAVADTMYDVLRHQFGNPSAQYPLGREAKELVEEARRTIAGALGCQPSALHFTSCGTESDNWAIRAAAWQGRHTGRHIITTAVEHSAVLEPCRQLEQEGYEVTYLKPDRTGHISAGQVAIAPTSARCCASGRPIRSRRSLPHGTPTMPCGRTPPAGVYSPCWRTMCWRAAAWCSVPGWTPSCGSAMKR